MAKDNGLQISYSPSGRNGSATITAMLSDDVLEVAKVDLTKPKARKAFAEAVCNDRDGIDREKVDAELRRIAAEVVDGNGQEKPKPGSHRPSAADLLAQMPNFVRAEARAMLEDPNLMERIINDVAALGVAGERELIATTYLVGTSRLLPKPLSEIIQGQSSSGKSYSLEKTASLFPPETVINATQMTPQALFYMPPGALRHVFIVAGERSQIADDDSAEAKRALREMQSAGRLSKLLAVKVNGGMETKRVEQDGPIAYVESTTLTKIFDEDANRCLLLSTDERPEQTQRIIDKLAEGYSGTKTVGDVDRIVQRHHAVQRMLQQREVIIPFAPALAKLFDSERVEVRRAFPQLMSMIQASALLHQVQRQWDRDDRIVACEDDYQLARYLLGKPLGRLLGGQLSDPARRYYERIVEWAGRLDQFTTTEADKHDAASRRAVSGWLSELCDAGVVEQLEAHKGNKPAVWRLTGVTPDEVTTECSDLPRTEDVFRFRDFRHSDNMETLPSEEVALV